VIDAADACVPTQIGVSEKTVELHLARARHKRGAQTTTQAVAAALVIALTRGLPARKPNVVTGVVAAAAE
jgi:FixJ family two-component response regulator